MHELSVHFKMMRRHQLALFLYLSLALTGRGHAHLCLIFGNCSPAELAQLGLGQSAEARNDLGGNAVQIDEDWIEAENSDTNQAYHFAKDAPAMTWFEADQYCVDKGGFLAEALSEEENNFLKGQAYQYPNVNWWTGLREAQMCKCASKDGRAGVEFDANIDYDSLTDDSGDGNGYVRMKCPETGGWEMVCGASTWVWSYSGVRMTFSDWNAQSGEPNGDTEHCVTMWVKGSFRWGDWHCKTTTDGSYVFKPLCQKSKISDSAAENERNQNLVVVPDADGQMANNDEVNDPNETEADKSDEEPALNDDVQCYDEGVKYKALKRNILNNIFSVESAALCQEMCAENPECLYWIWTQKRKSANNKCRLTNGILTSGFRRQKPNAVSGTMLNGCKAPNDPNSKSQLTTDYCIEYGAEYSGGDESVVISGLDSMEECRSRCLEENGCKFFTFASAKRRNRNRCLLRNSHDFRVFSSKRATSGSVDGECRNADLSLMSECSCTQVQAAKKRNSNGKRRRPGQATSLIDGRIANNEESFEADDDEDSFDGIQGKSAECPNEHVNRCAIPERNSVVTQPIITDDSQYRKGVPCVDYDINYNEGDQFREINSVNSVEECKQFCSNESQCQYYVWLGSSQDCLLKASAIWVPRLEPGTVSGSVVDEPCKQQPIDQYGFCECVELAPDYYDQDFIDLVGTGLINERSNICPADQGKRCYSREPLNAGTSSRIFFGN